MNTKTKIYQIGKWQFNAETALLKSSAENTALPKLLSQLLLLLIENKTRVISREELIETLWKNKYVNENALSRTIAELRKELHDSASQPQFIKTLPKKGYQFIHSVIDIQEAHQHKKEKPAINPVRQCTGHFHTGCFLLFL